MIDLIDNNTQEIYVYLFSYFKQTNLKPFSWTNV